MSTDSEWRRTWSRRHTGTARQPTRISHGLSSIGNGVTADLARAVHWYGKAAEQGYAQAQCNLGYCYEAGRGVEQDMVQAAYWYGKAADQNFARAQFNLGVSYENGTGVEKDMSRALSLYRKAAGQGYNPAQKRLAKLGESW